MVLLRHPQTATSPSSAWTWHVATTVTFLPLSQLKLVLNLAILERCKAELHPQIVHPPKINLWFDGWLRIFDITCSLLAIDRQRRLYKLHATYWSSQRTATTFHTTSLVRCYHVNSLSHWTDCTQHSIHENIRILSQQYFDYGCKENSGGKVLEICSKLYDYFKPLWMFQVTMQLVTFLLAFLGFNFVFYKDLTAFDFCHPHTIDT